ncbi:hypothetical protein DPX16_14823 [Anabarilius grahami]|uniref:Uncharacterized protein n=1 Tax=Anabarilius grahami TaxID=495550 RepID=A0A3N0YAZ8_ANAGA|nr:hypothetical protein DPX16_14823 [Anabarilius grahami]
MGILLTSVKPADRLLCLFQDGRSIEDYVGEFLEISHLVSWNDDTLKTVFWCGLDDHLYQQVPVAATTCSQVQYVEYVLWLSGSSLTVGEVEEDITTTPPQSPLPSQNSCPKMAAAIPEPSPKMAASQESCFKMAAASESLSVMATTIPESRSKMAAALPEFLPIMTTTIPNSRPAMAAAPEPSAKMPATPEPSAKMAATSEPSAEMAATPEPSVKMAATSEPSAEMAATPEPSVKMAATS